MTRTLPHGTWPSPLTAERVVAASVSLGEVRVGDDDVWWAEGRPEEGGRVQLVRHRPGGGTVDVLPEGYAARSRVHEYGGGAWWMHDASVFFANWADQRLHRLDPGGRPVPLTPPPAVPAGDRYADGVLTADARWVVCVRERHHPDPGREPTNELVAVAAHPEGEPSEPVVLVAGADFYAFPRVSPDGARLCWTQWCHPDMPWDATELWVGRLRHTDGVIAVEEPRRVAGGPDESVFQPGWAPDGSLLWVSDRTDWWNPYRLTVAELDAGAGSPDEPFASVAGDVGQPQWVFGQSRWCVLADGRLLVAYARDGVDHLGVAGTGGGPVAPVACPFTEVASLRAFGRGAVCVGGSPTAEPVVALLEVTAEPAVEVAVLRPARDLGLDASWWSRPEPFAFPTTGGATAHALWYRPTNPEVTPPPGERPPAIVTVHGGPTGAARARLDLSTQFWTSRGFAVVDVNYRGSTGYGRAYRRALDGEWGIADVEDCTAAARHLAELGLVDPDRLAVRGGSAGGFTALCALAAGDTFRAGASLYGVTDLEALARDTHKFESRYLDTLVGPYPDQRDRYLERSPIHHPERLGAPLIVFQGLEDPIVPPSQAEALVAALAARGIPHAYLAFEGEQHGFRIAANIRRVLEAELAFYARIFGFEPADDLPPLSVEPEG
jgi:dipeptidyl aminopeptidase/acylaminoacyl peptidase